MDRVQRNGGTFGILAGIALAILFLLFATSGITPEVLVDPAKVLPMIREQVSRWKLVGLAGALAVAFSLPFSVGVYLRTRTGAPTRAITALLLTLVGLVGHGLGSLFAGVAFPSVAAVPDQAAASTAYVAVLAADQAADALGNAFSGAGFVVFGWAILSSGALSALVGWVFVVAGIFGLLITLAPATEIFFLGSIILTIVALIWGGLALRRAAA